MEFSTGSIEERVQRLNAPAGPDPAGGGPGDPPPNEGEELGAGEIDPELEEAKQFLLDGFMACVDWVYTQRAASAGPHWKLTPEELGAIERPADRVIAKWTPTLIAWIPGFALKIKDEVVLVMVILAITRKRVKVDFELAAAASAEASENHETPPA